MRDFDVVVAGAGNAALAAANSAREEGADCVLVLEKASEAERGGNTYFSGGLLRIAYGESRALEPLLPDVETRLPGFFDNSESSRPSRTGLCVSTTPRSRPTPPPGGSRSRSAGSRSTRVRECSARTGARCRASTLAARWSGGSSTSTIRAAPVSSPGRCSGGLRGGRRCGTGRVPEMCGGRFFMSTGRIEINPDVMSGKPVVRGTRIPVELVLRKLGEGATTDDLCDAYPRLKTDDIYACLAYAADAVAHEETCHDAGTV